MESGKEKEEFIELTEVVEEEPLSSGKREFKDRLPPDREKKKENRAPFPPGDPGSASQDVSSRALKEAMTLQVENWAAGEGGEIIQRMAADFIPRITRERLSPELEKIRAEMAALRAQREGFSDRVEQWLRKEGVELVERISQETVSKIAAGDLNKEIEKVHSEMEKLRSEREALSRKYEGWFSSEGLKSLEQRAREAIPRIVREAVEPELEKFRAEFQKVRIGAEELNRRAALWFENEGRQVLEGITREIFPQIAEKILRQEIEKLKEEARTEEND
jgi:hypothetical protein